VKQGVLTVAAEFFGDSLARAAFASVLDVELDPEMHFAVAFDHLGATPYSAGYYTFLWSQVIAKDLWSAFDPAHPLEPRTARRYRDAILRPGKSRPAAEFGAPVPRQAVRPRELAALARRGMTPVESR
jgi:Zn-dependent oligopeptidase